MIISLYAGLLTLLYAFMSITTIKARRSKKVALGVGSENQIIHLVSAHSNFSSYVPLFLILFFLLESSGANLIFLHVVGCLFLLGRVMHFLSMRQPEQKFTLRTAGMMLTLWPLIALALRNLYHFAMTIGA